MKVVCAWCGKVMGEKPGEGVSHGICDACKAKLKADVEEKPSLDGLGRIGGDSLDEDAVQYLGLTTDLTEAIFIFPDGRMLQTTETERHEVVCEGATWDAWMTELLDEHSDMLPETFFDEEGVLNDNLATRDELLNILFRRDEKAEMDACIAFFMEQTGAIRHATFKAFDPAERLEIQTFGTPTTEQCDVLAHGMRENLTKQLLIALGENYRFINFVEGPSAEGLLNAIEKAFAQDEKTYNVGGVRAALGGTGDLKIPHLSGNPVEPRTFDLERLGATMRRELEEEFGLAETCQSGGFLFPDGMYLEMGRKSMADPKFRIHAEMLKPNYDWRDLNPDHLDYEARSQIRAVPQLQYITGGIRIVDPAAISIWREPTWVQAEALVDCYRQYSPADRYHHWPKKSTHPFTVDLQAVRGDLNEFGFPDAGDVLDRKVRTVVYQSMEPTAKELMQAARRFFRLGLEPLFAGGLHPLEQQLADKVPQAAAMEDTSFILTDGTRLSFGGDFVHEEMLREFLGVDVVEDLELTANGFAQLTGVVRVAHGKTGGLFITGCRRPMRAQVETMLDAFYTEKFGYGPSNSFVIDVLDGVHLHELNEEMPDEKVIRFFYNKHCSGMHGSGHDMPHFDAVLEGPSQVFCSGPVKRISPQKARDKKLFGPVYHGTTPDRLAKILQDKQGFCFEIGGAGEGLAEHGFTPAEYGYETGIPPVHFLGFGVYFTTSKSRAKEYGVVKNEFYLDVPRLEEINFAAPHTMMKWWVEHGYDPGLAKTDQIKATRKLTDRLKKDYDAVWFTAKSLWGATNLDCDQVCLYKPRGKIYVVDKSLVKGIEVGARVQRCSDDMPGEIIDIRSMPAEFGLRDGLKRLHERRKEDLDDDIRKKVEQAIKRTDAAIAAGAKDVFYGIKWRKGGVDRNVYGHEFVVKKPKKSASRGLHGLPDLEGDSPFTYHFDVDPETTNTFVEAYYIMPDGTMIIAGDGTGHHEEIIHNLGFKVLEELLDELQRQWVVANEEMLRKRYADTGQTCSYEEFRAHESSQYVETPEFADEFGTDIIEFFLNDSGAIRNAARAYQDYYPECDVMIELGERGITRQQAQVVAKEINRQLKRDDCVNVGFIIDGPAGSAREVYTMPTGADVVLELASETVSTLQGLPPCVTGEESACKMLDPHTRLKQYGAGTLRLDELLMIALGLPAETVDRLLESVDGNITALAMKPLGALRAIKGVGPKAAHRVKAWAELCARLDVTPLPHKVIVNRPEDLYPLIRKFRLKEKEHFWIALLDARNQVIDIRKVCSGTTDACAVHPRDMFSQAIVEGASSIIFIHNHPSGNPAPSLPDIELTKRIVDVGKILGIQVLDHLIVAGETVTSIHALRTELWD